MKIFVCISLAFMHLQLVTSGNVSYPLETLIRVLTTIDNSKIEHENINSTLERMSRLYMKGEKAFRKAYLPESVYSIWTGMSIFNALGSLNMLIPGIITAYLLIMLEEEKMSVFLGTVIMFALYASNQRINNTVKELELEHQKLQSNLDNRIKHTKVDNNKQQAQRQLQNLYNGSEPDLKSSLYGEDNEEYRKYDHNDIQIIEDKDRFRI